VIDPYPKPVKINRRKLLSLIPKGLRMEMIKNTATPQNNAFFILLLMEEV
jgi:hypothetical protein